MKQYILYENKNWADEFDVILCSIVDKKTYLKYQFLKSHFIEAYPTVYFGTNEEFNKNDNELNFLEYDLKVFPISHARIFQKYSINGQIDIINILFKDLAKKIKEKTEKDINLYELSVKKFKRLITKQFADQVYDNERGVSDQVQQ